MRNYITLACFLLILTIRCNDGNKITKSDRQDTISFLADSIKDRFNNSLFFDRRFQINKNISLHADYKLKGFVIEVNLNNTISLHYYSPQTIKDIPYIIDYDSARYDWTLMRVKYYENIPSYDWSLNSPRFNDIRNSEFSEKFHLIHDLKNEIIVAQNRSIGDKDVGQLQKILKRIESSHPMSKDSDKINLLKDLYVLTQISLNDYLTQFNDSVVNRVICGKYVHEIDKMSLIDSFERKLDIVPSHIQHNAVVTNWFRSNAQFIKTNVIPKMRAEIIKPNTFFFWNQNEIRVYQLKVFEREGKSLEIESKYYNPSYKWYNSLHGTKQYKETF